jgi:hypothetical protein
MTNSKSLVSRAAGLRAGDLTASIFFRPRAARLAQGLYASTAGTRRPPNTPVTQQRQNSCTSRRSFADNTGRNGTNHARGARGLSLRTQGRLASLGAGTGSGGRKRPPAHATPVHTWSGTTAARRRGSPRRATAYVRARLVRRPRRPRPRPARAPRPASLRQRRCSSSLRSGSRASRTSLMQPMQLVRPSGTSAARPSRASARRVSATALRQQRLGLDWP